MALVPACGLGIYSSRTTKIIRLIRHGCTNRPFYHIVVAERIRQPSDPCIEQLGTFDPMPNEFDQKLASFNFERVKYWIGKGALMTGPVAELLGLSGYLPIHPRTYMQAWRNRTRNAAPKEADAVAV